MLPMLRLMFVLFEVSMPAFGPARARRFSRADPESQYAYLAAWESSTIYFRRASMYGLRSVFAMAYLGNEEVLRQIGIEPGQTEADRHRAAAMDAVANTPGRDVSAAADVTVLADAVDAVRRRVSGGGS